MAVAMGIMFAVAVSPSANLNDPRQVRITMKARIKWVQDVMFLGESGSGHSVVMDGAPESGGRNLGGRPMEMLLMGLGGCSAFDVVMILKRGRQQIEDCVVELQAERAESD